MPGLILNPHLTMIKLKAKINPGAATNEVRFDEKTEMLNISIKPDFISGIANNHIVELLAAEFELRKSKIEIIKGWESVYKTIGIDTTLEHVKNKAKTKPENLAEIKEELINHSNTSAK